MTLPTLDMLQFVFAERLAPWLCTYMVHSSLLLVVTLLIARRLRTAAGREWLWKLALVGPLVSASLQLGAVTGATFQEPVVTSPAGFAATEVRREVASPAQVSAAGPESDVLAPQLAHKASVEQSAVSSWPWVLSCAWLFLALMSVAHFFHTRRSFVRQLGAREPVSDEALLELLTKLTKGLRLSGRVRLTESAQLISPIAVGRREICLPRRVRSELEEQEQRSLLAHELAHLTRRDPLWLTYAHLLERLFFIQPLLRIVRKRLSEDMEFMADAWAVGRTQDSVRMARCLAHVAEWVAAEEQIAVAPGMAGSPSQLVKRIEAVLEPQDQRCARRSACIGLVVGLLGLGTVAYAAPRIHGASAPPSGALLRARTELGSSWAALLEDHQDQPVNKEVQVTEAPTFAATEVPIGIGDVLRIYNTYGDDLTETVQGLGSIILPSLGRIVVIGKTRTQLERELTDSYKPYFDISDVHVQHTPVAKHYKTSKAKDPGWTIIIGATGLTSTSPTTGGGIFTIDGDLSTEVARRVLLDWLRNTAATSMQPGEALTLQTPTPTKFKEVQTVLAACEELGIKVGRVQLMTSEDGSGNAGKPASISTEEGPGGGPKLEVELSLVRSEEDASVRLVDYRLTWDLPGKAYSASAQFSDGSLAAIALVLEDLVSQSADYHVKIVSQRGILYPDVVLFLDVVIAAGFKSVTLVGSESK